MSESIDSIKKIIKGSSIILLGIFISKFFGYVYRILVARIGPEQYGLLSISLGITSLLTTISLLGLNSGILRYIPFFRGKKNKEGILLTIRETLKITTIIGLLFSIGLFIFSKNVAVIFFNNETLSPILKIVSFTIFFGAFATMLYSIILAFQKVKYQVLLKNLFENIIKIILTFVLVYILSYGVFGAAYAYLLSLIFSSIFSLFIINKHIFNFITFKKINRNINLRKDILFYSIPLMLSGILISITTWTDTIMLGHFKLASDVGIYNAALPTAQLIYIIPYMFMVLFLPVLTELYVKGEKEALNSVYLRITKWIFFLNFLLFSFLFLFSKTILKYLFGQEYVTGSLPLLVLSLGFFIGYLIEPIEKIFMIFKKTKTIFVISLFITLSNILLNYMLIPLFGITGAAIATSIAHISAFIFYAVLGYYITKINPFKIKYFLNIFLLFIFLFFIKRFLGENLFLLIPSFAIFIIVTILLLLLTKSLEKEDILFIGLIIKKIKAQFNK